MKKILMKLIVGILRFCYWPIKAAPQRRKVVFISRQSDTVSLDFIMLTERIRELDKNVEITILAKQLKTGLRHQIRYAFHMLTQMYHIATSKVVVLDGYCIAASVLNHKPDTKIVQMWHALGTIKKFGYQVLGTEEGSDPDVARIMRMHKNYDEVLCASKATAAFFSKAFQVSMGKFRILGMPRVDYIKAKENRNKELAHRYADDKDKPIILYIPTFRKGEPTNVEALIQAIDQEKYNLIIKMHPLEQNQIEPKFAADPAFGTYDYIKFADYVITDYSAVAIEASILEKPVFFYLYDYQKYKTMRGLNIDPFEEMPAAASINAEEIAGWIWKNDYDFVALKNFKDKYIETLDFNNTDKIANEILRFVQEG